MKLTMREMSLGELLLAMTQESPQPPGNEIAS